MRRFALITFSVGLALVAVGLGIAIFLKIQAEKGESPPRSVTPVAVQVAPVERGHISEIRHLTGSLAAAQQADISPKITGRIEHIAVDLGDRVERGATIALLDRDELEQDVAQARADLEVMRAQLVRTAAEVEQAKRDFSRIEQLNERRVASQSELDTAQSLLEVEKANYQVAEAEVQQREAALRSAEIRLSYAEVKADWTRGGDVRYVAMRYVEEGELVNDNETIVTLVDLGVLNALVYVTERDYPRLRVGQKVSIVADAYSGREFEGEVTRLAPRFEQTSRQARVEIQVKNKEALLKPGMFVRASVVLQDKDDVTLIPSRALATREGDIGVFVADRENATATFVPIQVGIQEGGMTEVISPEIEGEVVTLGQNLIDVTTPLTFVKAGEPLSDAAPADLPAIDRGG